MPQDWYTDLRNTACFVLEQLLLLTGPRLSHEARRLIYPELLKRLDDSSNQVGFGQGGEPTLGQLVAGRLVPRCRPGVSPPSPVDAGGVRWVSHSGCG